jgi:transposase
VKQITTIGLDLAKHVFQIHGADAEGAPVVNRKLRRAEVLRFFEKQLRVWSVSRPAVVRTTGRPRSQHSVTMFV